uniref:hypothetical protein n=1 Tax=Trichocoleus desertorum TaxID=1481672 RepID=UPI0025B2D864|nr:hypothetical protein [Trichocoleus desertorum]
MTQAQTEEKSNWQPYSLDRHAQELVLANRDLKDVLNESHKMRMAVGYGLERFWGEHLRLERENKDKAAYWKAVWDKLWDILAETSLEIAPDTLEQFKRKININANNASHQIKEVSKTLWNLPIAHQRIALMVLTQFCDALVWWTQRYKKPGNQQEG